MAVRAGVPVLEIGGTHVTAALVEPEPEATGIATATLLGSRPRVVEEHRFPLHSAGDAASVVATIVEAGARLWVSEPVRWGVAIPGPFDVDAGIGRYEGVGKFDGLNGFDLGAALREAMRGSLSDTVFVNDATAFALGECTGGAGRDHRRVICLTLGTGVGSAFIADGAVVDEGERVPPNGWMYRVEYNGAPLEDIVSRRAMRAAYLRAAGELVDVHTIAKRARAGERAAIEVFTTTMTVLGRSLAGWVQRFEADAIVVGGSIARSWDLVEGPMREAIGATGAALVPASLGDAAPLIGAAAFASRRTG